MTCLNYFWCRLKTNTNRGDKYLVISNKIHGLNHSQSVFTRSPLLLGRYWGWTFQHIHENTTILRSLGKFPVYRVTTLKPQSMKPWDWESLSQRMWHTNQAVYRRVDQFFVHITKRPHTSIKKTEEISRLNVSRNTSMFSKSWSKVKFIRSWSYASFLFTMVVSFPCSF